MDIASFIAIASVIAIVIVIASASVITSVSDIVIGMALVMEIRARVRAAGA